MASEFADFSAAPFALRLDYSVTDTDVPGNRSKISTFLKIRKNGNFGYTSGGGNSSNVTVDGVGDNNTSWTFNFSGQPIGHEIQIDTGEFWVDHDPDGTKSIAIGFSATTSPGTLGSAAKIFGVALPPIARASTPTFEHASVNIGSSIDIDTNRADSGFTHTLKYKFGSASGTIATGVGEATSWTPPMSLCSQLPSAVTGTATVTCETYNGATLIGTTTSYLTLTVPASVKPDFDTITHAEAVSAVSTVMGGTTNYVQGLSKLALAITSPTGAYGSTITAQKIEVVGEPANTINSGSGTTPNAIASSGTVTLRGTITDSRGRTYSEDVTVTVLIYTTPVPTVWAARRALSDGTLNSDGTYIRVDLNAAAQSLLVGATEKNALTFKIYTKAFGGSTWTLKSTVVPGAIAYNSHAEVGTYSVGSSFDVMVELIDKFSTVQLTTQVGTSAVPLYVDAVGIGAGKVRENGSVDALLRMYQRGFQVVDSDDLAAAIAAAVASTRVPAGVTGYTVDVSAPSGWLLANGSAVSRTTYADLYAACNPTVGTFTVTIATPGVFTLNGHGMQTGQQVTLTTTGSLPTGLNAEWNYWVIRSGANTFRLATSLANARAGTAIATSGTQSGTHTLRRTYGVGNGSTTFNVPSLAGVSIYGLDSSQADFAALGILGGALTHRHEFKFALFDDGYAPAGVNAAMGSGLGTAGAYRDSTSQFQGGTAESGATVQAQAAGTNSSRAVGKYSSTGDTTLASSLGPMITLTGIVKT